MVLWTLTDDQPTPVFRFIAGAKGEAIIAREEIAFQLVDISGASRYGVSAIQRYVAENGTKAEIRVAFGLGFDGGVYLEQAIVTLEDNAGWKTVTPAAGLAGCRA
ncbi:MAG: hypothetical protein AAF742_04685 [Pseudomonadota bacterium]